MDDVHVLTMEKNIKETFDHSHKNASDRWTDKQDGRTEGRKDGRTDKQMHQRSGRQKADEPTNNWIVDEQSDKYNKLVLNNRLILRPTSDT